jgi:hypothetical protein
MSYERAHRRKPRAYVSFDSRGADVSRLSDEEKERLRKALGVEHVNGVPAPPVVTPTDPALVGMLLQAIASLEGMILARKFKLPAEACQEACKLREPVSSALAECTARILDKYNVMGRYQDEVAALSLIVVWQSGVFSQLRELEKEKNETRDSMGAQTTGKEHSRPVASSVTS